MKATAQHAIDADLQLDLQTEYVAVDADVFLNETTYLLRSFRWLNWFILYLPMWAPALPDRRRQPRSKCVSITIVCFIVVFVVTELVVAIIYLIHECIRDARGHGGDLMISIKWTLFDAFAIFVITMSRLLSLHYFYRHFRYPWNDELHSHINTDQQSRHITRYKWFLIATLSAVIALELVVFIWRSVAVFMWNVPSVYYYDFAMNQLHTIFVSIPMDVTFATTAVVFIKYHVVLLQITDDLQRAMQSENGPEFSEILEEYKRVKKLFDRDYPPSLQRFLFLYSCVIALELLVSLSVLFTNDAYASIEYVELIALGVYTCQMLMCFIPASLMSEAFVEFESLVHEYGSTHAGEVNYGQLNYFLWYMTRHPLAVKIGRTMMTKKGTLSIIVLYVVAKLFAYSFYSFGTG